MKRSRRSEYDRKKNRNKKKSERKLSYNESSEASDASTSSTSESSIDASAKEEPTSNENTYDVDPPESVGEPKIQEKKYITYSEAKPTEKPNYSTLKIVLIVAVTIFSLVRLVKSFSDMDAPKKPAKTQRTTAKKARKSTRRSYSYSNVNVSDFFVGKGKVLREVIQLEKDSVFPIIEHVNVRLFKRYHIFDTTPFENTEILAKFSKFYFLYNRVEASPTVTMDEQWLAIRNTLAENVTSSIISQEKIKNYTFKGMEIEQRDFKVLYDGGQLHGVATLIEYEGQRHFFQFISKEKDGTYFRRTYLRRYLNYYLKIR